MLFRWLTLFLDFPAEAFDAGAAFWREVTSSDLSPFRGETGEFATLLPPDGDAYLRVQRTAGGSGGCHLDLHADPAAGTVDQAAERAVALGATVRHASEDLVIMGSPGGFTFCLVRWHGEGAVPAPLPAAGGAGGVSRPDTLCLDVPPGDFDREVAFWAALTGLEAHPAPVPGYAYLTHRADWAIRLLLQRREQTAPGDRTRGHVDFGCTDAGARSRHVALGARVTGAEQHWTVLADPAGLAYCLVGRDPK